MFETAHYIDRYEPSAPGRGGSASSSKYESRHASSSRQNSRFTPYPSRVDNTPGQHWKTKLSYDSDRYSKKYYDAPREYEYRRYSSSAYRRERSASQAREDGLKAVLQTRRRSTTPSSTSHDQRNYDAHPVSHPPLVNRIASGTFPSQIRRADPSLPSAPQDLSIRISGLSRSSGFRYIPFSGPHEADSAAREGEAGAAYGETKDVKEHRTDEEGPVLSKEQLGEILKTIFETGNAPAPIVTQEQEEERSKTTVEEGKEEGEESERSENASQDNNKLQTLQSRLAPPSANLSERLSPLHSPSCMPLASLSPSSAEQLQDRLSEAGTPAKTDAVCFNAALEDNMVEEENDRRYPEESQSPQTMDEKRQDEDTFSSSRSPVNHQRYESQEMPFSSSTDSNESFHRSPASLYDRLSCSPDTSLRQVHPRSFLPMRQTKHFDNEHRTHTPDWIKEYEVVMPSGTILCDRRKAAYAPPSAFRTTSSSSYSRVEEYDREEGRDRKYAVRDREREREVYRGSKGNYWRDTAAIVGNMVDGVSTGDVKAIFSEFGEIVHVSLIPCPWQDLLQEDVNKCTSSTSALIIYADSSSCERASEEMDGVIADDRALRVEYIRKRDYPGRWPYVAWRMD